ncbi:ribbon-helix-helix domain-containing protein [Microbulbifer sp. S227A]|uniref:ribbon-helix-helix domain-containing protein n=1 Tax=Microbulbifer sp. S227A TaxID=3415131 RepID=UPI003C7A7464
MSARPRKHSLTLRGHRTSVSLEDEFWSAFRQIAEEQSIAINVLAARIDEERGTDAGLATAIRVFVLAHYQTRLEALEARLENPA